MYIYILTALAISIIFYLYNYIFNISSKKGEEKELYLKERMKDSFVLFVLSGGIQYLVNEYFHNDFISKIFPKTPTNKPTEIFTDQPGF